MTYKNDIGNIFKESFESFELEPSNSLWKKINKNLAYKDFLRFNPGKFNIYYSILILATASTLFYFTAKNNESGLDKVSGLKNNTEQISNNVIVKDGIISENEEFDNLKTNKEIHNNTVSTNKEKGTKENKTEKLHNEITVLTDNAKVDNNVEGESNLKLAKPMAEFSASVYEACEPASISFYNSSVNCDGYLWEFGNGETSSLSNPTFVFITAGVYRVKLTVSSGGFSSSVYKDIVIHEKPKARFSIKKTNGYFINEEIVLDNMSINYTDCSWSFGDGETSDYDYPAHTYNDAGKYNITLICTNDFNCTDAYMMENIDIKEEKYKISIPTAFYLNTSGAPSGYWKSYRNSNTIFYPIFDYEVEDFVMRIYNKYGTLIFESNDNELGWNGYFNGQPQKTPGTYIYTIEGKFTDGKNFIRKGSVHMLPLRN